MHIVARLRYEKKQQTMARHNRGRQLRGCKVWIKYWRSSKIGCNHGICLYSNNFAMGRALKREVVEVVA